MIFLLLILQNNIFKFIIKRQISDFDNSFIFSKIINIYIRISIYFLSLKSFKVFSMRFF